jgi:hypothetical protein
MRVLRPGSGTTYTGAGTSASVASVTGLNGPFATSLPIQAADHVGLDATSGAIILGDVGAPNMALSWSPTPLADGESRSGSIVFNREVLVQASVDPTNTVTFGAVNRNRKKGTARVTVTIPNAGALTYAGSRAKVAGPASVAGPADIQLTVRAKGRSKRKLNETGKVKVAVDVIFTPTNGTAGTSPNKVKLLKRLNT